MRFHVAQMCGISSLTSQMSGFCCRFNKCTRCYLTFAKNNLKNPLKQVRTSRKTFIRKWMTYKAPAFRTTKKAHVGFKKYFLNPNSLLLHIINKTLSDLFYYRTDDFISHIASSNSLPLHKMLPFQNLTDQQKQTHITSKIIVFLLMST